MGKKTQAYDHDPGVGTENEGATPSPSLAMNSSNSDIIAKLINYTKNGNNS